MNFTDIDKRFERFLVKNRHDEVVDAEHTYYHINCPDCPDSFLPESLYEEFLNFAMSHSTCTSSHPPSSSSSTDTSVSTSSTDTSVSTSSTDTAVSTSSTDSSASISTSSTLSTSSTSSELPLTANTWETIPDDSSSTLPPCEHEECYQAYKSFEKDSHGTITCTYLPFCKYLESSNDLSLPSSSCSTSSYYSCPPSACSTSTYYSYPPSACSTSSYYSCPSSSSSTSSYLSCPSSSSSSIVSYSDYVESDFCDSAPVYFPALANFQSSANHPDVLSKSAYSSFSSTFALTTHFILIALIVLEATMDEIAFFLFLIFWGYLL
ncbi:unnamed protein product [[Candida] boidinii]|uniref:Unnamed protein product n=1 Tax=Candida boidinii TaxID=5477 RepID=A0ACB5TLZ5_CANBO|nr:unnamed protein product [[Candida] boidinii]